MQRNGVVTYIFPIKQSSVGAAHILKEKLSVGKEYPCVRCGKEGVGNVDIILFASSYGGVFPYSIGVLELISEISGSALKL